MNINGKIQVQFLQNYNFNQNLNNWNVSNVINMNVCFVIVKI